MAGAAAAVGLVALGYFALRGAPEPEPGSQAAPALSIAVPDVPQTPTSPSDSPAAPATGTAPGIGASTAVAPPPPGAPVAPREAAAPAARPDVADLSTVPGLATAPSFDVVRVEPDGTTLIAGRAMPSARVAILLDGSEIATSTADGQGGFVVVVSLPPAARTRVLSLLADHDGQTVASAQSVIVAPTAEELLAAAPPAAAAPPGGAAPPVIGEPAPEAAPAFDTAAPMPAPATREAALETRPEPDAAEAPPAASEPAPGTGAPDGTAPATPPSATPPGGDGPQTDPAAPPQTAASAPPVLPGAGTAEDPVPGGLDGGDDPAPPGGAAPTGPGGPAAGTAPRAEPPEGIVAGTAPEAPATGPAPGLPMAPSGAADTPPDRGGPARAPRLLMADEEGLRVIQDPDHSPDVMSNVSIDTITYDTEGEVVLGGRGRGDGFVRIYLDNDPIRTTRISPDGQWRADLPRVDTRVYTLRVDEITEAGDVVSRAETPFRPEAAEDVEAAAARSAAAGAEGPIAVVTVQPGFTLWRIARENYGAGRLYVRVFEANSDKIRDPDLIYPGQIFTVPQ